MVAIASPVSAQLVVYDAATTARNTVTAAVKEFLFETAAPAAQQAARDGATAERVHEPEASTRWPDVPRWRTHGGDFFFAQAVQRRAELRRRRRVPPSATLSQRLLADRRLLARLRPARRAVLCSAAGDSRT